MRNAAKLFEDLEFVTRFIDDGGVACRRTEDTALGRTLHRRCACFLCRRGCWLMKQVEKRVEERVEKRGAVVPSLLH